MKSDLFGGIPAQDLAAFHERVLYLVENAGIQVPHGGLLRRLADFDGVRIDQDIVTFRADLVDKHVFDMDFDLPPYCTDDNLLVISGNMNPTIRDFEAGAIRLATAADLVRVTKLEDSYGVTGSAPITPGDVPKHLQEIALHKILWENSRFKGNDIYEHNPKSTVPCCEYVRQMAQVVGKRFTVGAWIQSPRTFNPYELDIVYRYLDADIPLWVGNYPMYGVTTPIFVESGMAQAAAELFAGYLMLRLLHGGRPVYVQVIDSIMGHPVDWKFTNPVLSSVEDVVKTVYQVSLNRFYHIPLVGLTLLSAGKGVDFQQGYEKAIHTIIAALLGVRAFRLGGMLALDMVYSPEQLVCDCEMMEHIKALLSRGPFDVDKVLVDEIMRVGPSGSFLTSDLTYRRFREEYYEPRFFDRSPVGDWLKHGSQGLEERAHAVALERVKGHSYELPADQQRELDRIYACAARDEQLAASYR